MPPVDTIWFFEVFLSGFMTVWTFRYFSNIKEKYAEFEWLALSAFWGLFMLALIGLLPDKEQIKNLLMNPFAAGLILSVFGLIVGYAGSRIRRIKWFKWVINFLGKGKKDKSEDIF